MRSGLPPEIEAITTPQGERYVMPTRQVGCLRIAAIPVLVIGLVFLLAGCYTSLIEGGLWDWLNGSTPGKPLDVFNALFGLVFISIGYSVLYLGTMMLGGRSIVELRDDRVIATQRSGPFRWRRKIPLNQIKKFQIKSSNMDEATVAIGASLSALNVVMTGGGLYSLAWGYPKSMLRVLADHLSEKCDSIQGARLLRNASVDAGGPIAVEETVLGADRMVDAIKKAKGELDDSSDNEVPKQPPNSKIRIDPHDAGVTITVPPVGVGKGSKGMFGFSILWNGFILLVTVIWLFAGKQTGRELLIIAGVLGLFLAVGIWMLIASINAGRRQAILDVVGDTLLITRQTIFKTSQQEVTRDNIKSIRRAKSGVEVNDEPVLNLQVRLHEGKKISMFSQLADDELSWLAAVLREAMDVHGR